MLGVMPEPGGYAIAKFSRTAVYKSYKDWVLELTEEGAEKFYNSFYFQYGHASIADLAHLMVVVENISIPARMILLDDQLIDAQSRSTRYVDYSKCDLIVPPELQNDKKLLDLYKQTCCELTGLYQQILDKVTQLYIKKYQKTAPKEMDEECVMRTLHARAFDVARYVLPGGIPKSMGVIGSARTWERIITKFLSSPLLECQQVGQELQEAICKKQAFNPGWDKIKDKALAKLVFGKNIALPTLVKYAQKNEYPGNLYQKIQTLLPKIKVDPDSKHPVRMHQKIDPEIDLVTTLFYKVSDCSYKQLLAVVKKMPAKKIKEILDLVYQYRQEHDGVPREAALGNLTFDICLDIGAYRDLHRHRNVIHIIKGPRPVYGFEMLPEIAEVGLKQEYMEMMAKTEKVFWEIEKFIPQVGQYILPQATRRRVLMKMSPWELQYLSELRTKPAGHISYRTIAYKMYEQFARKYPDWGKHFRVTDYKQNDFWKR